MQFQLIVDEADPVPVESLFLPRVGEVLEIGAEPHVVADVYYFRDPQSEAYALVPVVRAVIGTPE